jgi:hypothetical protein
VTRAELLAESERSLALELDALIANALVADAPETERRRHRRAAEPALGRERPAGGCERRHAGRSERRRRRRRRAAARAFESECRARDLVVAGVVNARNAVEAALLRVRERFDDSAHKSALSSAPSRLARRAGRQRQSQRGRRSVHHLR